MAYIGVLDDGPIISVDDDKIFHTLMRIAHRKSGHCNKLLIFDSGSKCIEYLRGVAKGICERPSIILMDVNMPGMNGFETLEKIRNLPEFVKLPPICMLSATCEDEDVKTALDLGADEFWEKPLHLSSIPVFTHRIKSQ